MARAISRMCEGNKALAVLSMKYGSGGGSLLCMDAEKMLGPLSLGIENVLERLSLLCT